MSVNHLQQLGLEDELALLILLTRLIGLVVFPTHDLIALSADDVTDDMSARGHVALHRVARVNVDHAGEEEGFAVLTAEVSTYDVIVVGEMGLALLAAEYLA